MNRLFFKETRLQAEELHAFLVPLERMEALRQLRPKAALDVVVHSQVSFNDVSEVPHNLIRVFVEQSLELAHFFIVVEVLLVLCVELNENVLVVL